MHQLDHESCNRKELYFVPIKLSQPKLHCLASSLEKCRGAVAQPVDHLSKGPGSVQLYRRLEKSLLRHLMKFSELSEQIWKCSKKISSLAYFRDLFWDTLLKDGWNPRTRQYLNPQPLGHD